MKAKIKISCTFNMRHLAGLKHEESVVVIAEGSGEFDLAIFSKLYTLIELHLKSVERRSVSLDNL